MANKFKLTINIRSLLMSLIMIILVLLSVGVLGYTIGLSDIGHNGDSILVSVDGYELLLQEAITSGLLSPRPSEIDYSECVDASGWCENELLCPDNYAMIQINPGAPCGRTDGRFSSRIRCCKIK